MVKTKMRAVLALGAFAAMATGTAQAQIQPYAKCLTSKLKCAVNKQKGLLGCEGKAAKGGLAVDPACLQKAYDKFSFPAKGCMEKAETKPPCATTGDAPAIEAKIDAFVADVVAELYVNPLATAANACAAGKMKCVTNLVKGLVGCESKAIKGGVFVDPACLQKVMDKFTLPGKGCFDKLELPGKACSSGGTQGDAAVIKAKGQALVDDLLCELDPAPNTLTIQTTSVASICGHADSVGGALIDLNCGDLSIGDGSGSVPAGATPPGSTTKFNLGKISGSTGGNATRRICGRNAVQTGSSRNCSTPGCFFGSPLPIVNGPLSTCVTNTFAKRGTGIITKPTGQVATDILLQSAVTVTSNDTQPCPHCVAGSCDSSAANSGAACSPDATTGESHDCIASGPALTPFAVSLAGATTASSTKSDAGGIFCPGQANAGAFGEPSIVNITESGVAAGDLDLGPGPLWLGSVFCIPATGNGLIDGSAGLPGPGAIALTTDASIP